MILSNLIARNFIWVCTLREKCQSIAKQMLLTKFDCDDEILYISMKYILFLWNIFYFCEIYFINCKKNKIDGLFVRNKILFCAYLNKYLFQWNKYKIFLTNIFLGIFFSVYVWVLLPNHTDLSKNIILI